MLRFNRKPYRYQSSYSLSRKKRSLPRLWVILVSIPVILIGLEILMRVVTQFTGKAAELDTYQGEPANITAYRLKYLNPSGESYDGLPNQGRLMVKHSPLQGYRLLGNQQSNFWQINAQGFRTEQAIAPAKPKDEVRIFVLGGSTAFGQLSSTNQSTFVHQLETRLNTQVAEQKNNSAKYRPAVLPYYADELAKAMALPPRIRSGRYRVVNAAVPGYISSNELAQLALQLLAYKPDMVVVVDGYSDLLVPSTREGTDIPGADALLTNASSHFTTDLSQSLQHLVYQSYLVKGFQYWVLRPHESVHQVIPPVGQGTELAEHLTPDQKELSQRVARYQNSLRQMARLTTAAKIPLIVALQPEITQRNPDNLTPREKTILNQLGSTYPQRIQAGYDQLRQAVQQVKQEFPKGVVLLNLKDDYANAEPETFQDAIHLTAEGNKVLANRLYDAIAQQLVLQPQPYNGAASPE